MLDKQMSICGFTRPLKMSKQGGVSHSFPSLSKTHTGALPATHEQNSQSETVETGASNFRSRWRLALAVVKAWQLKQKQVPFHADRAATSHIAELEHARDTKC